MPTTTQIPREQWPTYFDHFTQEHLRSDRTGLVTLEVLSPRQGDQVQAQDARLLGLSFEPEREAIELQLEGVDPLRFQPAEIWVLEGESDFIAVFELVHTDGTKELIHVKEGGPLMPSDAAA